MEELLNRVIEKKIKATAFTQVILGLATAIMDTTCTVKREGMPDLLGVRLDAVDDSLESQFTVYPKENSNVIVGIIDGLKTEAVILRCSEVANIKIKCGGVSLIETFSKLITEITTAIIDTSQGPGAINAVTVTKLNAVETDFKKIFK
jgi:hypothetical protein